MSVPTLFMMRDRVFVTPYASIDAFGAVSYNTVQGKAHRARVVWGGKRIRASSGEEVISDGMFWLHSPTRRPDARDRYELGAAGGAPFRALKIEGAPDPRGVVRVYKITFGQSKAGVI